MPPTAARVDHGDRGRLVHGELVHEQSLTPSIRAEPACGGAGTARTFRTGSPHTPGEGRPCRPPRSAGTSSPPATRIKSLNCSPPSVERANDSVPSYSVQAACSTPPGPRSRSRLPLCQISLVSRPFPSPARPGWLHPGRILRLDSTASPSTRTSSDTVDNLYRPQSQSIKDVRHA